MSDDIEQALAKVRARIKAELSELPPDQRERIERLGAGLDRSLTVGAVLGASHGRAVWEAALREERMHQWQALGWSEAQAWALTSMRHDEALYELALLGVFKPGQVPPHNPRLWLLTHGPLANLTRHERAPRYAGTGDDVGSQMESLRAVFRRHLAMHVDGVAAPYHASRSIDQMSSQDRRTQRHARRQTRREQRRRTGTALCWPDHPYHQWEVHDHPSEGLGARCTWCDRFEPVEDHLHWAPMQFRDAVLQLRLLGLSFAREVKAEWRKARAEIARERSSRRDP